MEFSIKGTTRSDRAKNVAIRHQFSITTSLPDRDKASASSANKVQLINIICYYVCAKVAETKSVTNLVVTGSDECPTQVHLGVISEREDLRTTHEEADIIIVQQCFRLVHSG